MYVFSLVPHVLSGTLACLVITDQRPLLVNFVDRFAESDLTLCLPKRDDPGFVPLFSSPVSLVSSAYLLDCLDSTYTSALTWTHVFASSNFRDDIARALKTDVTVIWRFLSAHGR